MFDGLYGRSYCMVLYVYSRTLPLPGPAVFANMCRMSESLLDSTVWCRVYILAPYHILPGPSAFAGMCIVSERVSESLLDSTVWNCMYILAPYTPAKETECHTYE